MTATPKPGRRDEAALVRATDNVTHWLLERGYRHVLVEIDNE